MRKLGICLFVFFGLPILAFSQTVLKGKISDQRTAEPLIGANIVVSGTTEGNVTDWDGFFELITTADFPLSLTISYLGYVTSEILVTDPDEKLDIRLEEESITINVVEVKASRLSEELKKSPLTIESMDLLAVKETPASNFYEGLGALKGVDLTTASLGFQIVNTRGFNSTSPVRSLQIIDGVDNQAPGLNFSLGNFLGSSELDVLKVDMIVGASSAFYGPSAFNGVVSMETKNPFLQKGLSAFVKTGERNMIETAFRMAHSFENSKGHEWFGYKLNFSYLRADDWPAENDDPVFGTLTGVDNPGRYNRVNTYGDEYSSNFDASKSGQPWLNGGLGIWHRTGYRESDLVDYDTRNLKSNISFHFRTSPSKEIESPELILSSNYSNGTTVYQGDNRFSLKNIQFYQNRIEFAKKGKFFVRAYMTRDNAGDSYDPYFTALVLQRKAKPNSDWAVNYTNYWTKNAIFILRENGYPNIEVINGMVQPYDFDGAAAWVLDPDNRVLLDSLHSVAEMVANQGVPADFSVDFFEPGTERFDEEFNRIITTSSGDVTGGTKFIDRSSLYHLHGEYTFEPTFADYIKIGSNARLYTPESEGTVFVDSIESVNINNFEYGIYGGIQKSLIANTLKLSATIRMDKNENYEEVFSPAASIVWNPSDNNFLRVSFSSAVRNPTLTDQYLDLNVGRAILRGNLEGTDSLITLESFDVYRRGGTIADLERFIIDPIKPERVRTIEAGYRTTLFNSIFMDASYFYSTYNDFIGYNIGIEGSFDAQTGRPTAIQVYRYSANSTNTVNTQGFAIGLNYYFGNYKIAGNYSWNKLVKSFEDDPIIPAFNTPEHKYNIGFGGRNIQIGNNPGGFGFNVNYKWIEGYIFEGSPQFTGFIPSYGLLDAQINYNFKNLNTTFKLGASNILDNQVYQTYGGPRVGRLAYASITYEFRKD